jgi:hypothetical protein
MCLRNLAVVICPVRIIRWLDMLKRTSSGHMYCQNYTFIRHTNLTNLHVAITGLLA